MPAAYREFASKFVWMNGQVDLGLNFGQTPQKLQSGRLLEEELGETDALLLELGMSPENLFIGNVCVVSMASVVVVIFHLLVIHLWGGKQERAQKKAQKAGELFKQPSMPVMLIFPRAEVTLFIVAAMGISQSALVCVSTSRETFVVALAGISLMVIPLFFCYSCWVLRSGGFDITRLLGCGSFGRTILELRRMTKLCSFRRMVRGELRPFYGTTARYHRRGKRFARRAKWSLRK
jgi:hypothetical protein